MIFIAEIFSRLTIDGPIYSFPRPRRSIFEAATENTGLLHALLAFPASLIIPRHEYTGNVFPVVERTVSRYSIDGKIVIHSFENAVPVR